MRENGSSRQARRSQQSLDRRAFFARRYVRVVISGASPQVDILPHHPSSVRTGGELPPLGEAQTRAGRPQNAHRRGVPMRMGAPRLCVSFFRGSGLRAVLSRACAKSVACLVTDISPFRRFFDPLFSLYYYNISNRI